MANNTKVVGYVVECSNGYFLDGRDEDSFEQPAACTQAEAYRRVSVYLTQFPNAQVPEVIALTRDLTPMENASRELSATLKGLLERHGLDLGLTDDQIERQITKELVDLASKR
jgi:hypothetical protein